MKLSSLKLAVLPLALFLNAAASHAAVLSFTYVEGGGSVLTGTMNGDLQLDGNTFIATGMGPILVDSLPVPALPFVNSVDFFFGSIPVNFPVVTLDGSFMDIFACDAGDCLGEGLLFASGNQFAADSGLALFEASASFGGTIEVYDSTKWSASVETTGAPEPGTLALGLGAGLVLLGWKRRSAAR